DPEVLEPSAAGRESGRPGLLAVASGRRGALGAGSGRGRRVGLGRHRALSGVFASAGRRSVSSSDTPTLERFVATSARLRAPDRALVTGVLRRTTMSTQTTDATSRSNEIRNMVEKLDALVPELRARALEAEQARDALPESIVLLEELGVY